MYSTWGYGIVPQIVQYCLCSVRVKIELPLIRKIHAKNCDFQHLDLCPKEKILQYKAGSVMMNNIIMLKFVLRIKTKIKYTTDIIHHLWWNRNMFNKKLMKQRLNNKISSLRSTKIPLVCLPLTSKTGKI